MDAFDYVIVGGGTAGCIIANRLTASGSHRVLLLEAGGEPASMWINIPAGFSKLLTNAQYNWRFQTEAEENTNGRVIAVPRGKGLGGSTLINGMVYVRGQAGDYDAWRDAGARGWGWNDVEPYFRKLENYDEGGPTRGHDGPMKLAQVRERFPISDAFIAAAQEDGLAFNDDYNAGRQEGVGYYQATQSRGRRWSAYDGYLRPALSRKNLTVVTHAHVLRLELDGKRCTGVTYLNDGRETTVDARVEVILAAGAIQSPQLLELSGIGQPELLKSHGIALRHELRGVGENYIDHFCTRMNWRVKDTVTLNEMSRGWRLGLAVSQYYARRTGILTLGTGLVNAFVKTRPEMETADAQFFFVHASYANAAERVLDKLPGMTIGVTQLRPHSIGTIHIKSPDAFAGPSIRPNFLSNPVDQVCMVESMRIARRIVERPALRHHVVEEMSPGSQVRSDDDWVSFARQNGQTIYHPIGTCRMGEDDGAVVDLRLRVRGLDGVRVVDAAVMPKMVSGNIQAAVMMVAEKAADLILEDAVQRV
jgi:choline dehydrogenase-like flavoprotein